jgi:transposase
MNKALPNLANLPPDVQAFIAAQTTEVVGLKSDIGSERAAHSLAIQNRDTIIADLRMQLDGHKNTVLARARKVWISLRLS